MMRNRICLLALALSTAALADDQAVLVHGWADVDAAGHVGAIAWQDDALSAPMRAAASEQLRRLQFAPARVEQHAVPARTWVSGELVLHPDGDEFVATLHKVDAGPHVQHIEPARYPMTALRRRLGGALVGRIAIATDGTVSVLDVSEVDGQPEFAKAVRTALGRWRFEPEQLDGVAVPSTLCVPFVFSIEHDAPPALPATDACTAERAGPRAPAQSPWWTPIEIHAERR